ncbi:MAG: type II toxin-antitoxin system VapC family toxin [Chloroflexi bacterium]|nr:type II toxin-antitoxin system VapC family toxin [Ardenticatenaceae bacterium]MBL1127436.1 type II toxin-antitoxin system VapC family toxin [Chloroflexota bacterium]NOG33499.1 type II toxin-antitoxin system VapC family toxin [Chloroflexota bacterium]GIK55808.1 MAG: toxin FitB [Chloroflexota bacterium]
MRLKYLLDTNIVSEPLRPQPNPTILANLQTHQQEIAIASVVWHELWFGCLRLPPSRRRTAVETYLQNVVSSIPLLAYDERAAHWHAAERAQLTTQGKPPPFADGQIAAVAAVNHLQLVTLNTADYVNFQGVQLTTWT